MVNINSLSQNSMKFTDFILNEFQYEVNKLFNKQNLVSFENGHIVEILGKGQFKVKLMSGMVMVATTGSISPIINSIYKKGISVLLKIDGENKLIIGHKDGSFILPEEVPV